MPKFLFRFFMPVGVGVDTLLLDAELQTPTPAGDVANHFTSKSTTTFSVFG